MKRLFIILSLLFPFWLYSQDTIRVGHQFQKFSQLELGTKTDLITSEINGRVLSLVRKSRTAKMVQVDGKEYLFIEHVWKGADEQWNGQFQYLCEPGTLKPVQHIRFTQRNGKEAYAFTRQKISGLDSAVDNSASDFELLLESPTYNWEIDLETYSLLPMRLNYTAVMNFYHPGGTTPPAYYELKIIGEEPLTLPDGRQLDCWILFTDYGGKQPSRFWYTKTGQNFVKMEGKYNQLTIRKERIF